MIIAGCNSLALFIDFLFYNKERTNEILCHNLQFRGKKILTINKKLKRKILIYTLDRFYNTDLGLLNKWNPKLI